MPIPALARALSAAAAAFLALSAQAQLRPLNFTTPSYIELERTELRAYEGSSTVTINVFRTGEFRVQTKVDFETIELTATGGADFKAAGGTLVFQPGEGMKSISLEVLGDDETEAEETFQLKLSCSSPDVVLMADSASIFIEDAPLPISNPALSIEPAADGQVRISWRGSAESILEFSAAAGPSPWTAVDCQVETEAGRCHALVPAAQAAGFFRLRVR